VVNVAVAWGLAFWLPKWQYYALQDRDRPESAPLLVQTSVGVTQVSRTIGGGFISLRRPLDVSRELPFAYRDYGKQWGTGGDSRLDRGIIIDQANGWPLLSLWASWDLAPRGMGVLIGFDKTMYHGIDLDPAGPVKVMDRIRVLPLGPIWPGFIINTLFYTLLLWLLFFAPFAARRTLRRRRGLCRECAYPIGVSPVCTECGAAVSRKETMGATASDQRESAVRDGRTSSR
jgi:hypothetical protein